MIQPLRIGSLFSGIGGLELGIQRGLAAAGVPTRTLWQVEQNEYARAVLRRHWPHAERYTDVRDITAETVRPITLLAGGFPCQDVSYAGKGAGLAGDRSGLFFEMARIVRELRPRIVVMENVPAINTRGLGTVLGTLAALGYAARWGGLRASEVGAPHRRQTESGMGGGPHGIPRGMVPHRWPAPPGPQHPHEPPRTRPREKHDRDRLKALGNAVVPQCAEIIGRWIGSELLELK